jgi:branched-chain amino acid transport system ATP-binding protein
MSALLEVQDLQTAYGSSQVLFGVNWSVASGDVATLLGRNGMGKTTTVRSVLGLTPARTGRIRFLGESIESMPSDRIARMGMAVVPEGRQVFGNLSVRENLVAFAANRNASADPWTLERVLHLLPALVSRLHHMGDQLSGGEQQMVAIGRALMTNPHLLILDEATEGLAPLIREDIWRCLATLRDEGQTIVVIDKYVQRLLDLANHHTVLERGQVVWTGDSAALRADPERWQRYLGV